MKSLKLKKILAMALVAISIATVIPVSASAEWRQDSSNKWNWSENGSKATGWKLINGTWYRFDSQGTMYTGWINDRDTWYYTDNSGAMKTGWIMHNGVWYFTNESGAMLTGVVEVDGKVYCLSASGAMLTGNVMINGIIYTFAATGEAVGNIPKADRAFNVVDGVVVPAPPIVIPPSGGSGSSKKDSDDNETLEEKINREYKNAASINIENVEGKDNQFKVTFKESKLESNGHDYVTRDLYVTDINGNNDGIDVTKNEEDGSYIVKNKNKKEVKIRGVIRVVDSGKIYYVTQ